MSIFFNVFPLFLFLAFVVFAIYYFIILAKDSKQRLDQNEKIIKLLEKLNEDNTKKQ